MYRKFTVSLLVVLLLCVPFVGLVRAVDTVLLDETGVGTFDSWTLNTLNQSVAHSVLGNDEFITSAGFKIKENAGFIGEIGFGVANLTGYVVKNLARRQIVYGTLMYQLSHAGVAPLHGRSVGYFGFLSGHALAKEFKVCDLEKKPRVCPVCGEKLVHVCRVARATSFRYAVFEECFVLDDVDNWVEVVIPFKKRGVEGDDGYDAFAGSFEGSSSGG